MNHNPSDQLHIESAAGWLGLGDWQSAKAELDELTPTLRAHPDVLKMRVAIHCAARQFDRAATISDTLAEALPEDAQFWLNRAIALCQLGQWKTAQAAILICFNLKPDLQSAALDNPDLQPLWLRPPA